jgi:thiamine biosynthesis lipoprotein
MGTFVTITVISNDEGKAENAINLAFKEMERVESLLSEYKLKSEVSLLNKNGFLNNASEDLLDNIKKAMYYSELSDGAFDITVKPILELYKNSFKIKKRAPTEEEINETLVLVNYKNIEIKGRRIKFLNDEVKITLGGIAKGYAIDRAMGVLQENGIKHGLVNAGGDMRAIGDKNGQPWRIALENPRNKSQYIAIIYLENESVATSGDYERYFDPEKKFHHIVNPKTGHSARELISVTIIAENAIDADALATSVFVLGYKKGLQLIENLDNVEGLLITKDRKIIKSSGFAY